MKFRIQTVFLLLALTLLGACVTTRYDLIRQKEADASGESKSLPAPEPVKPVTTEEIARPAPPPTAPEVANPASGTAPNSTPPQVTSPLAAEVRPPMALPVAPAVPAATPAIPERRADLAQMNEDELRAELARTSGHLEEVEHEKQEKEKAQEEELKKATGRIAELEKQLKDLSPDMPLVPAGKTPFTAGKDAFAEGHLDEAIAHFTTVLASQEAGKDLEEATYLRGEAYFKKVQYNKAIVDFSHFPEKYPKSNFHPKALLRIAECFELMGRKEDAKAFYSDLLEKFPKTAEGKLARKRLKK